ncbi:MAG: divalent-cation tolerance protein CutA [Chloroflexota bacterium]|nr:MAG: divalent-cation tolerance protein CutA [Chloroflexota bacterium]
MSEFLQVVTTIDTQEGAQRIADDLVARLLAACVQIAGPITSTYRWEGSQETTEEWVCTIKTMANSYESVERAIRLIHPYDVPEILATPISAGNPDYLQWLRGQVEGA